MYTHLWVVRVVELLQHVAILAKLTHNHLSLCAADVNSENSSVVTLL
jgi:hypothetical protein